MHSIDFIVHSRFRHDRFELQPNSGIIFAAAAVVVGVVAGLPSATVGRHLKVRNWPHCWRAALHPLTHRHLRVHVYVCAIICHFINTSIFNKNVHFYMKFMHR